MRRISPVCTGLLSAVLLGASALAGPAAENPTRQWHTGPVRYLLTRTEAQAFKQLDSEAERATFIEAFWLRRDPTPNTVRNEFRQTFEKRVRETEALRLYQISTKEMWRTDLGKIFILLGPAIAQERDQNAASERDMVIWSYDRVDGIRERNFNVVFVADESGELRLSTAPRLDRLTTRGLANPTPNHLLFSAPEPPRVNSSGRTVSNNIRAANAVAAAQFGGTANYVEARQALLSGTQDLVGPTLRVHSANRFLTDPNLARVGGGAAAIPVHQAAELSAIQAGDRRKLQAEVRARSSFETLPVELRTDFYRADDGTTYAAFTLEPADPVSEEIALRLRPFGGIISADDAMVSYSFSRTDLFAAAGADAPGTFQTGLGMDPGRYRVLFGLEDPLTGQVGVRDQTMEIPDLQGDTLRLSTLTLARELRALGEEERSASKLKIPFVMGALRVVPRTDTRFHRKDEFQLYYQIYDAVPGADGRFDLETAYRFARETADGWEELGSPIPQTGLTGGAQAWAFPLQQWPTGRFRLTVMVTDRITGQTAGDSLAFEVID